MLTPRTGGLASLLNAALAIGSLIVVFGGLGPAVAADPSGVAALVTTRPAPLLALEAFKVLSAAAAMITILVLHRRLAPGAPQLLWVATGAGLLAALLLAIAGVAGTATILYARQAAAAAGDGPGDASLYLAVNTVVNGIGLAALAINGVWYGLTSWAARRGGLPRGLTTLGLALGILSLVAWALPPLALLVLVLGLGWSIWLGLYLLNGVPVREGVFA